MYVEQKAEVLSGFIFTVEKQELLLFGLRTCARVCVEYPGVWACACAYVHVELVIQHATRMRQIVQPQP
jgi:hypothetical protein